MYLTGWFRNFGPSRLSDFLLGTTGELPSLEYTCSLFSNDGLYQSSGTEMLPLVESLTDLPVELTGSADASHSRPYIRRRCGADLR